MFKRSVALIIVLSLCFSAASFAGKPVKLSNAQMQEVQGAVAPLILVAGAVAGSFAIACSVDLIAAQYDYFSKNPEDLESVSKALAHKVNSINPVTAPLEMAKAQAGLVNVTQKDEEALYRWGKYTGDKNIEVMTKPENIIAGITGGVGEVAGLAYKGAIGTVKVAEAGNTLRPFAYGVAQSGLQQGAELGVSAPLTCYVENNYQIDDKYNSCVTQKYNEKIGDPLTYAKMVGGGMLWQEGYNVAAGVAGAQLARVYQSNQWIEGTDLLKDVIGYIDNGSQGHSSSKDQSDGSSSTKNELKDNWIVNTNDLNANKTINPNDTLTQLQNTYTGQVVQVGNDLFYELGDKITTYQVDGKTYDIVFDKAGNPTCGYDGGSSHHDSDDDDDKPAPGPSPGPGPSPAPSKVIKSTTTYSGPTINDIKSAQDKISKGATVKDLTDKEKAAYSSM